MARPRSNTDETVLERLKASAIPMTAYELLAALRDHGVQSPPIVYRALERLEKTGQIHRLEQQNAYFACHGHHHGASAPVFAVCTTCRRVEEWSVQELDAAIGVVAARMEFAVARRTVEISGTCARCRGLADPASEAACCEHDHHSHD
jgi:Fur family transcriptional regulator, zinc uptake regulator